MAVGSFQVLDGNISAGNLEAFVCMPGIYQVSVSVYVGFEDESVHHLMTFALTTFCIDMHIIESVLELSSATGGFLKAQGSGARLFNLLDEPANISTIIEKESSLTLPPCYNASIRFQDVEFAYPSHSNNLSH